MPAAMGADNVDSGSSTRQVLRIRGGQIYDPEAARFSPGDVLVADGRIARLAARVEAAPGEHEIDATGLLTAKAPPSFADILPYLRAGDVVTHMYHPGPGALVDRQGRVRPEYVEARKRGVLFDTGTARFHLCFPVARAALDQGFLPDTISTDLTMNNYTHITIDLPTTLSKFLAFGLPLEQVFRLATIEPARALPPERGHGRLAAGLPADLALFELASGDVEYQDFFGNTLHGERRLVCRGSIKGSALLAPEAQEPMPLSFMRK